jgi:hypothetical protein
MGCLKVLSSLKIAVILIEHFSIWFDGALSRRELERA